MKAVIDDGKIFIPKKIRKRFEFPEKGECELEILEDGLKILKPLGIPWGMIKILEKLPIERSIEDMMKDEVVEDAY